MKTIVNTIPGYRAYEYVVVLNPHEELVNKINSERREFAKKYKSETILLGRPHITLVNFVQYEMMEERIMNRLKTIAMGYAPFRVDLKNFGNFPSHTLYINVVSKLPIQGLVKQIRGDAQRIMKLNDEQKPHFIIEPYIPIARKLKPWQYEKGWLEYSNLHFSGRFIADKMLLLKRPVGGSGYQVVQRLQFENLPVSTKQGELFG